MKNTSIFRRQTAAFGRGAGRRWAASVMALLMTLCAARLACAQCVSVRNGSREERRVALTVDDCYSAVHVREILELCDQYGIKVTFFVLGNALKTEDAALWRSAVEAGHEIGSHAYEHRTLTKLSATEVASQLERTQQRVDELLEEHYPLRILRPPYGSTNYGLEITVEKAGYLAIVRWDVSQTNADEAFKRVQNGSILLYHANRKDVDCLEALIPMLLKEGYECVTVSQLLGLDDTEATTNEGTRSVPAAQISEISRSSSRPDCAASGAPKASARNGRRPSGVSAFGSIS